MSRPEYLPWPIHTPLGNLAMVANKMITNSDHIAHKQEKHFEKNFNKVNLMKKYKKTSPNLTFKDRVHCGKN